MSCFYIVIFDSISRFRIVTSSMRPFQEITGYLIKRLDNSQNDQIILATVRF
jgi:hypothetical protein